MSRKRNRCSRNKQAFRRVAMRVGLALVLCLFLGLLYFYVVAPYAPRWMALYGNQNVPEGYSIRGIDVSHHQGRIDWDELSQAHIGEEPISFVFVKATEGVSVYDQNFRDNFENARECGFVCGAYHYFSPRTPARQQAAWYLAHVKLHDGDLPPVLDIEEAGDLGVQQVRQAAREWLTEVQKRYAATPIIYTYYKFKQKYLNTKEFDMYPYWIAHYYVRKIEYKGPWKFWQHTDCGRLPGIKGEVDLNVYNGSMYDLRQLCVKED